MTEVRHGGQAAARPAIVTTFWRDDEVTGRMASVMSAEEVGKAVDDARRLDAMALWEVEKASRGEADRALLDAVRDDVRRHDSAPCDSGWQAKALTLGCEGSSSFRLGHLAMIEMIGFDYDGFDYDGMGGLAEGLASLARELVVLAAECYANIPEHYYPMEREGGFWLIRDVTAPDWHAEASLRVPLSLLGLPLEEFGEGGQFAWDWTDAARHVADEFWERLRVARAQEVRDGWVCPLPISDGEGGHPSTDWGYALQGADIVRFWDSAAVDVDRMRAGGDVEGLRRVIDAIVDMAVGRRSGLTRRDVVGDGR